MARHKNSVGVASVFGHVLHCPRERGRNVFDLRRVRMLRGQPITRHDGDVAGSRVTVAKRRVVRAVSRPPGPAVNEKQHRRVGFALGQVDIQFVFAGVFLGALAVGEILERFDIR